MDAAKEDRGIRLDSYVRDWAGDRQPRAFVVAGPNNVFDAGYSGWAILFDVSVALLMALQIAGLWSAGRILLARSQ